MSVPEPAVVPEGAPAAQPPVPEAPASEPTGETEAASVPEAGVLEAPVREGRAAPEAVEEALPTGTAVVLGAPAVPVGVGAPPPPAVSAERPLPVAPEALPLPLSPQTAPNATLPPAGALESGSSDGSLAALERRLADAGHRLDELRSRLRRPAERAAAVEDAVHTLPRALAPLISTLDDLARSVERTGMGETRRSALRRALESVRRSATALARDLQALTAPSPAGDALLERLAAFDDAARRAGQALSMDPAPAERRRAKSSATRGAGTAQALVLSGNRAEYATPIATKLRTPETGTPARREASRPESAEPPGRPAAGGGAAASAASGSPASVPAVLSHPSVATSGFTTRLRVPSPGWRSMVIVAPPERPG